MANAQPKCPSCEIQGLEHIVSKRSVEEAQNGDAWFNIAYCDECGHVYGIFNKVVHEPTVPSFSATPNIRSFFGDDD